MHALTFFRTHIHFGQFNYFLAVLQADAHLRALRFVLGMAHTKATIRVRRGCLCG